MGWVSGREVFGKVVETNIQRLPNEVKRSIIRIIGSKPEWSKFVTDNRKYVH